MKKAKGAQLANSQNGDYAKIMTHMKKTPTKLFGGDAISKAMKKPYKPCHHALYYLWTKGKLQRHIEKNDLG